MNNEDAIQAALDANPNEHFLREVLADLLLEQGDPRADGYRALGQLKRVPHRVANHVWKYHFNEDDKFFRYVRGEYRDWYRQSSCVVTASWMLKANVLARSEFPRPRDVLRPTRRKIEDLMAKAFNKLKPDQKARLLERIVVDESHLCEVG